MDPQVKPPRILIRADANGQIASGHVMRCLSVASCLLAKGAQVELAAAGEECAQSAARLMDLAQVRLPVRVLEAAYDDPKGWAEALLPHLADFDLLLLDTYYIDAPVLKELCAQIPTAYIDDLYAFEYECPLVINYDPIPRPECYQAAKKALLGPQYAPLRPQFSNLGLRLTEQAERILITAGGTDPNGLAATTAASILMDPVLQDLQVDVLCNPSYQGYGMLTNLSAGFDNLHLLENVRDMAGLMRTADLAVSAAGTTLFELCAASVPAVSFSFAENQVPAAEAMQQLAGIPYVGDIRPDVENAAIKICEQLRRLVQDTPLRMALAAQMHSLVDGRGAERIADELLKLLTED